MDHWPDDDPIWIRLRDRVIEIFQPLGPRYDRGKGDWYLLDEDTGQQMVKIELVNLDLLRPKLVRALQAALRDYPEYVIALAVDGVDENGKRRGMGVWIEAGKIIDDLQRDYLPASFRDMTF